MNDEDEALNDNEISTKRRQKKDNQTNTTGRKRKGKKYKKLKDKINIKEDSKNLDDLSELAQSYKKRDEQEECISHLESFYNKLKEKQIDLESIITKKNLKYFQNINPKEHILIDLLLMKIYVIIFSSEDFYQNYFSNDDENEEKITLVLSLIEEPIEIINNFSDNFISLEIFKLKENVLKLIKFIYINSIEHLGHICCRTCFKRTIRRRRKIIFKQINSRITICFL